MRTRTTALARERIAILAILLALSAAAWIAVVQQAETMRPAMMGMDLTMGMDVALFVGVWVVMMVAMMFPSAAPMILTFAAVYRGRKARGQAFVPVTIFVAGYLLVWTLFGGVAYLLALAAGQLAGSVPWLAENAGRIGGALIVIAGLYQLSQFKSVCLSKCRTPAQFVLTSWHNGRGGALRMGLEHGVYCLGCCWLLFLVLFPLGVMNLVVMALLTAFIFAEKALPAGRGIARAAAVVLIGYGALVLFVLAALPGSTL